MRNYLRNIIRTFVGKRKTLEELYGEALEKIEICPQEIIETPEALGMPRFTEPGEWLLKGETYKTPNLFTVLIENAIYSPRENILIAPSRHIISESLICGEEASIISLKKLLSKPIETIPGYSCVFLSSRRGYYHTMIVHPPRLSLINRPEYRNLGEIKLLCPDRIKHFEEISIQKLAPSNAKPFIVKGDSLYRLENVILPSFSTKRSCGYLPKHYLERSRKKFLPERSSRRNQRIYISRIQCSTKTPNGRGRHVENENQLMEKLSQYGFKKYLLENLSFEEQKILFYDAEIIVSPHGAGLSNLIFADKTSVLELHPRDIITPTFYYLCKSLGCNYKYWSGKIKHPHNRIDFLVNVEEILNLLSPWL
ncbi:MAG: glycosyltransferase family 61 protein [Leptolyngbya sp. SIO1D8]|nr:glycosyltransferase family 61 protein [Leptolyngbya sp. SIO1D8]